MKEPVSNRPADAVHSECSVLAARRPRLPQQKLTDKKQRFLVRLMRDIARKVFDSQRIPKEVSGVRETVCGAIFDWVGCNVMLFSAVDA